MYVIIIGGGRVGYHLARALIEQDHEVLIIEKNANYCNIITAELGSICVHGDGCETATLAEVGTKRADLFVAVTGDDVMEHLGIEPGPIVGKVLSCLMDMVLDDPSSNTREQLLEAANEVQSLGTTGNRS